MDWGQSKGFVQEFEKARAKKEKVMELQVRFQLSYDPHMAQFPLFVCFWGFGSLFDIS